MERYICIHGHFYQPPRENAWLEDVELQDSAYPYHDWNERITAECYAPNTASRIVDAQIKIIDIMNNYSKISFDAGPTLLSWMERHQPGVYQAIIEADQLSRQNYSGHGSALAQVYNHMIMPLANRRDKETQVYWGIRDFSRRFGREPEGMWLPETAVDNETLEVLAEQNIQFTILAPSQAKRTRPLAKEARWTEAAGSVDPTKPYLCLLPSGRSVTVFFYDGPISHDIAFGGLLNNGEAFAKRLLGGFSGGVEDPQLVHVATDGESYGHHHKYGEMALSYCLHSIESTSAARLTNYGEYLAKHPAQDQVEIVENSSWSCIHGVDRWREHCGCATRSHLGWTQAWRKPLREACDGLRDRLLPLYEQEASKYLNDPWLARNEYIQVIHDRSLENVKNFLNRHARRELSPEEKVRVLKLLDIQRNGLLMYTSCGWFFSEISDIETTQVLQYTSKAIQYAEEVFGISLEEEFLKKLAEAPSYVYDNGRNVYDLFVKPARVDLLRVAAHYGISSIFAQHPDKTRLYGYTVESEASAKKEVGRFKLALGRVKIVPDLTWEERSISYAVLDLGDLNISGGVRIFYDVHEFARMRREATEAFQKGDITGVLQLIIKYFGRDTYSLWHLFKDEQRRIIQEILAEAIGKIEESFRTIYDENSAVMDRLSEFGYPIPAAFHLAAEYGANADLKKNFNNSEVPDENLQALIARVKKFSFKVDKDGLRYVASQWLTSQMEVFLSQQDNLPLMEKMTHRLRLMADLNLDLDLWKAQNIYFAMGKAHWQNKKGQAERGDEQAKKWIGVFKDLGSFLYVRIE
jgi:alpha-amylase/alpha-mannosidase (GH57 family)